MNDWPVIIGMVHLPALPGAPGFSGDFAKIVDNALDEARQLADAGVDAVMVENFGDVPFFKFNNPAPTIACMTHIVGRIVDAMAKPVGVNVLRNDALAAMSIAHATGAAMIRVNVLTGARVTDQGVIEGCAAELLRLRSSLKAGVRIMADVDVKHSAPLAARPIEDEIDDTIHRGLADALIVSGAGTGKPTDPDKARKVKQRAGNTPVYIGSGIDAGNIARFKSIVDGFIVGSAFKVDGKPSNPLDPSRIKQLIQLIKS